MIVKRKASRAVIGFLEQNKVQNLNILGYLQNHGDALVWIYNNDLSQGIIVSDAESRLFYADTHNKEFLQEFWKSLPQGHKMFSGVPLDIADKIIQVAGQPEWSNDCDVVALLGDFCYIPNTEFKRESLTAEDAEEVNDFYTYKSETSYQSILESIQKRDTECIKVDGRLLGWVLVHEDNSMGPLYVKEEFRGRRMAKTLSERLMQKLIAKNIIPYGHIVVENFASHAALGKTQGMKYTHKCCWFGYR